MSTSNILYILRLLKYNINLLFFLNFRTYISFNLKKKIKTLFLSLQTQLLNLKLNLKINLILSFLLIHLFLISSPPKLSYEKIVYFQQKSGSDGHGLPSKQLFVKYKRFLLNISDFFGIQNAFYFLCHSARRFII